MTTRKTRLLRGQNRPWFNLSLSCPWQFSAEARIRRQSSGAWLNTGRRNSVPVFALISIDIRSGSLTWVTLLCFLPAAALHSSAPTPSPWELVTCLKNILCCQTTSIILNAEQQNTNRLLRHNRRFSHPQMKLCSLGPLFCSLAAMWLGIQRAQAYLILTRSCTSCHRLAKLTLTHHSWATEAYEEHTFLPPEASLPHPLLLFQTRSARGSQLVRTGLQAVGGNIKRVY